MRGEGALTPAGRGPSPTLRPSHVPAAPAPAGVCPRRRPAPAAPALPAQERTELPVGIATVTTEHRGAPASSAALAIAWTCSSLCRLLAKLCPRGDEDAPGPSLRPWLSLSELLLPRSWSGRQAGGSPLEAGASPQGANTPGCLFRKQILIQEVWAGAQDGWLTVPRGAQTQARLAWEEASLSHQTPGVCLPSAAMGARGLSLCLHLGLDLPSLT